MNNQPASKRSTNAINERHCISSSYDLMRLVLRGNNPNKETLIYIPLSHVTVIQAHTTPTISVFYYYYYSSYPDIQLCELASQHTQIHIRVKQGCYWKPAGVSTNYVYSGSRAYPGPRPRMFRCLVDGTCRQANRRDLLYALIMMVPGMREPALPSVAWRPTGQTENLVAQHT